MARENQSLRRRAAVAVLSGVLEEDALLEELWGLQNTLHGDSVSNIIECVDALASRHMLDASTCKRLYAEFFKALRQPESALPLDPWPAMQAMRPKAAPGFAAPPGLRAMSLPPQAEPPPPPPPAAPVPAAAPVAPAPAVAPPVAATATVSTEAPAVFGAVMRALISELAAAHREALDEVRNDAMRALARSALSTELREQYGQAWDRALSHNWRLQGPDADLAALMKLTHGALVLAFGRVGADQIVARAMAEADKLPQASHFLPRQLMA